MIEMAIACVQRQIVLQHQGGEPHVARARSRIASSTALGIRRVAEIGAVLSGRIALRSSSASTTTVRRVARPVAHCAASYAVTLLAIVRDS
jgi:hypothetical protein